MSKTLKMLLLVAVVIVIAVAVPYVLPAVGSALGIGGLAVGGAVAMGSALTLTGMIVSAVIVTGLTMLASLLLTPKPPKLNQSMNDRLNSTVVPTAPRKIVFGKTAGGADVRFEEKVVIGTDTDDKPDYYYQVIALASHKINSVQSVYFENEQSYNGSSVMGKYASGLQISHVLEGSTGNAASFGSGSYWTSSAKFTGCAYLKVRFYLDQKILGGSIPSRITTIVEGCPVFDPRLSTACGGSGSMDPNNQSTWAYYNSTNEIGRNPACVMATYMLGYKINGVNAWGMQIPSSRIDWGNIITYANICDESVAAAGGGTVKRYQCDAIFDTNMTHEAIISGITASMGTTKLVDTSGLYQFVGGHDDTAGPILTFTQDDLIGSYEWTPAPTSRERFNIVSGRFASPPDLYQLNDWGRIALDPLPDGINRTQNMDFAAVSRAQTCQRIAKQMLLRNQVNGQFTCNFGPRAFAAQVGSLLYLSLPAEGWNNKLFRVIDQTETVDLVFSMILQEEDAEIYAWDSSEEIALPANVHVPGYDPVDVAPVNSLTATARQVANSNGGYESMIDLTWQAPTPTAVDIQVQAKEHSGSVWMNIATMDAHIGSLTFKAPAGGISTDIQARYKMASGAYGSWASITVTAAAGGSANTVIGVLAADAVTFAADNSGNVL